MAERGHFGEGSSQAAALPSHEVRERVMEGEEVGERRHRKLEKQIQDLQWVAKMQRRARSKGEKGWARPQQVKIKKKFADRWLVELEEQAKTSEVGKATGAWDKTSARLSFEAVARLRKEKEELQEKTIEKIANELQQLEQLDEQLGRFGQQAGSDSSEEEGSRVVAAVREADGFEDQGDSEGSMVGCEQGTGELQVQLAAAQRRASEAEDRLRQMAEQ